MKTYGQYCPIVRASEIFAERWTPVVIRNILLGCTTFTQIARGAPGMSKTLLAQRLRELERVGVIEAVPSANGHGSTYSPTDAGRELWDVCNALGRWGARWLELAPEHLDPYVVLWSMCRSIDEEKLPERRMVVRFDFPDQKQKSRFWMLYENRGAEVCVKPPGFDEDLLIRADSEWFTNWHLGRASWTNAVREGHIAVEGPRDLARSFPSWNKLSSYANVRPATRH